MIVSTDSHCRASGTDHRLSVSRRHNTTRDDVAVCCGLAREADACSDPPVAARPRQQVVWATRAATTCLALAIFLAAGTAARAQFDVETKLTARDAATGARPLLPPPPVMS